MDSTDFSTGDVTITKCFTPEQLRRCFTLRHKIYCEDLEFEGIQDNRLEIDCFDKLATHYTIQNDNVDVGYFRVVPEGTEHLSSMVSTEGTFEISRFIIKYQHRHPLILSKIIIKLTELLVDLGFHPSFMILEKKFARFITRVCKVKLERKTDYFSLNGRRAAFLYVDERYSSTDILINTG